MVYRNTVSSLFDTDDLCVRTITASEHLFLLRLVRVHIKLNLSKKGEFSFARWCRGFLYHPLYPFECVLERVKSALEDGAIVGKRLLESCEGMKEQIREKRRVLDSI